MTGAESASGADAATLRAALVETLRSKGCLRSPSVTEAFAAVSRHLFVPHVSVDEAYRDRFIVTKRLADGEVVSSSSQPEIMATMLEQLDVRPGHRVLEIGAGTGYNAALLAHLVGANGRVTAVDIDEDIVSAARAHLDAAGVSGVRVVCGDGWAGDPAGAPFDRIVLTVGAGDLSPSWCAQLAEGGRLLLPLALPAVQASVAFDRRGRSLESVSVRPCFFMRLRGVSAASFSRVAVGPDPAPAVWPRGNHFVDSARVHALLQTAAHDVPTAVVLPVRELYDGIIAWLGLHEPTSAWFAAEGKAVATGLVPPLFDTTGEAATTFGLFEPDGIALLVRATLPSAPGNGAVCLGVRGYGDAEVAERLRARTHAWDAAGRDRARASLHAPRARLDVLTVTGTAWRAGKREA